MPGDDQCTTIFSFFESNVMFPSEFCPDEAYTIAAYEFDAFDPLDLTVGYLGSGKMNSNPFEFSFYTPPSTDFEIILFTGPLSGITISCSPTIEISYTRDNMFPAGIGPGAAPGCYEGLIFT